MKLINLRPVLGSLSGLLLSATISGAAITVDSASPGYRTLIADPGPDGLAGQYWDRGVTEIPTTDPLIMGGWADTNVYSTTPTGTFVFSDVTDYVGNDLTPVSSDPSSWLGADASTYIGTAGNLDDGIIRLTGFFCIANPNTITSMTLNTDDGSRLFIGGQQLINNDGSHGDVSLTDTVTFVDAGYYPVEVRYFNGDWTSDTAPGGLPNHSGNPDPGVHGGANFRIDTGNLPMIQSIIPEPNVASLVVGLAGLIGILRRRRK
ncbi:MAG: PA14 domain-containing protein [Verrucomicrobiales bacterium]